MNARKLVALAAAVVVAVSIGATAEAKLGGGNSFKGGSGGTKRSSSSSSRSSSSSSSKRSSSSSSRSSSSRSSSSSGSRSSSSSWSGSSSGYSGSGGDASGTACCVLLLVFAVVVVLTYMAWRAPATPSYERVRVRRAPRPDTVETGGRAEWLERLVGIDPNFSVPAFLDFAVLLYMRAQQNRSAVRPYVHEIGLAQMPMPEGPVETVCVGGAKLLPAQISHKNVRLAVRFEASATLTDGRTVCSHEIWSFLRPRHLLSKEPEELTALGCPACGNPSECRPDGTCTACDNVVTKGGYHWNVREVEVENHWTQKADEVGGGGGGGGDDDPAPTAVDRDLASEKRAFLARYPGFSFEDFGEQVTATYLALQAAWTERRFEKARPYESDTIFQTHRFWMESFKRFRKTNVLEDVRVERLTVVKVARDAYFDSITVRIWMSMIDYTKDDETGRVLSGDPKTPTRSTEYWTFVRRSGFDARRAVSDPGKNCPSCGAPVKINMQGVCEHCSSKVTSGKFGWVLSRIDQDSVYTG